MTPDPSAQGAPDAGPGSAGATGGLNDLRCLFQLKLLNGFPKGPALCCLLVWLVEKCTLPFIREVKYNHILENEHHN